MKKPKMKTQAWTMAFRNIARRPRRTILSVLAIGLAALTMTVLFSLVAGLKYDMAQNIQRFTTGQILIEDKGLMRAGARALDLVITPEEVPTSVLKQVPGVQSASPRLVSGASVFQDGDALFFPVMGMDFTSDPMKIQEFLLSGGTLPRAGEREALISTGLAEKINLKEGDTITAVAQTRRGSSNGITFKITGLVKPTLGSFQTPWLFTSLETAQRLVKLPSGATSLLVTTQPNADLPALSQTLNTLVQGNGRPGLTARLWNQSSSTYGLMDMAGIVYALIGLIFIALASTVIINTMLMVVLERSKEIGMLGALGMDQNSIRGLFLAESALLSGLGALIGVVLGSGISLILGYTGLDFTAAMKGINLDISSVMRPLLEPQIPIGVFALSTLVALSFTLIPLRKLKKMPIVEALRGEV